MKRIVFIADPLENFNLKKDSTYALMREAAAQGHSIFFVPDSGLSYDGHAVRLYAAQLSVFPGETPWYKILSWQLLTAQDVDVVFIRKDPPFDQEYLYMTQLLSLLEHDGVKVINKPQALRDHNEKLGILRFQQWIAPTLVSRRMEDLRAFLLSHTHIIVKPLDSMGGDRIFKLQHGDPNTSVILEVMTRHGQETIMAQQYIPAIRGGDKRILVINGQVVSHCLARLPKEGETRGNLAAGGHGEVRPLTARDFEIAHSIAPILLQEGILLAGLDVIGDYLTEVNITSPTCFQEIEQGSDAQPSMMMMDAIAAF